MKRSTVSLITVSGLFGGLAVMSLMSSASAQSTFSGTVTQVWEDGFRLNTGDRTLVVDSWDICGDFTAQSVKVSDRLTVTGEFEGGEFDAFAITHSDGTAVCR